MQGNDLPLLMCSQDHPGCCVATRLRVTKLESRSQKIDWYVAFVVTPWW